MKNIIKLTLTALALVLISMTVVKPKKIIFFGDSITAQALNPQGFITLIQGKLKEKGLADQYELVGAGVSGNKIYDLFFRLDKDVLDKKPDEVFIYIGVNDVWHKASSGTGTDLNKFEQFYAEIIRRIQATGAKVVLCTPAVIGERKGFTNQQDGDLNMYSQTVADLAVKYKCELINLRKIFTDYQTDHNPQNVEKGVLTADRVHLNPTGNQMVADLMFDKLVH